MEIIILDKIEFKLDLRQVMQWVKVDRDSELALELAELVKSAEGRAKPKAVYGIAYVDEKREDQVVIEGVRFTSRVLRVNLDQANRVFPFVVTCGRELEEWSGSLDDPLHKHWAEAIKGMALAAARSHFEGHLKQHYHPGKTAMMNPGSLQDWPIQEQHELFQLLGDVKRAIGVEIKENFFMSPTMTVSGIRFPTEESFESCMLCPREDCPGRRARYDKELYQKKYR